MDIQNRQWNAPNAERECPSRSAVISDVRVATMSSNKIPLIVIGIDPGPAESGLVSVGREYEVINAGKIGNEDVIEILKGIPSKVDVAVESIQSYGMIVGKDVFSTCYMIGRIIQVCIDNGNAVSLYPRPEYGRRICGVQKVTDSVLRRSLMLRFGGDKKGEPLNLLKGDVDKRSAFAVAVYHLDVKGASVCQSPP